MLSIIGTLIGLFGSFIPELLKLFKAREDHKHELAVLSIQAEMMRSEYQYRLAEIEAQADISSEQAVYKQAEQKTTGIRFIDGLLALYAGTIRPTLTYMFTIGYFLVKVAQYQMITASGNVNMWETIWRLWNSEDMAAFMTIIGFWFGGRLLKYNLATFVGGNGNGNGFRMGHSQPALVPTGMGMMAPPKMPTTAPMGRGSAGTGGPPPDYTDFVK